MKIQSTSLYTQKLYNFKSQHYYDDFNYDYGTYYNRTSIKDTAVSATVISGIMFLAGALFLNNEKITEVLDKGISRIKKVFYK